MAEKGRFAFRRAEESFSSELLQQQHIFDASSPFSAAFAKPSPRF
jgi:hypothetical protein